MRAMIEAKLAGYVAECDALNDRGWRGEDVRDALDLYIDLAERCRRVLRVRYGVEV